MSFQKPLRSATVRDAGSMPRVSYGPKTVACSCGWSSPYHPRDKVTEDRIDAHLRKRHGGRGLRL